MEFTGYNAFTGGERVCDLCLIKKTKCDRQKPTCSRCAERGRMCTYSTSKRKPGPPKGIGSNRSRMSRSAGNRREESTTTSVAIARRTALTWPGDEALNALDHPPSGLESSSTNSYDVVSESLSPSTSSWKGYRMIDVQGETSGDSLPEPPWHLSPEAKLDLLVTRSNIWIRLSDDDCRRLQVYFESIQPLYPLFRKPELLHQYDTGSVSQAVLAAIFAVSAALSTNAEVMMRGPSTVGEHYATLTRQACSPLWISDLPATVSDLKAMFLLALYDFRTSPNRRAWATSGHLVRLSYYYGLHQVDNLTNCSFYEPGVTTSTDLEGWRYLWWSIYILDSYCNSAAGTPSNIDLDSLCTALPAGSVENWTQGLDIPSTARRFLRYDVEDLSNTLRDISSKWLQVGDEECDVDVNFTIRVIITFQIQEVSQLRRATTQNPSGKFQDRQRLLLNHLAATRLALPVRYQDPQRKVYFGESTQAHALRLVNLLEMKVSNLPLVMPGSSSRNNEAHIGLAELDASIGLIDEMIQIIRSWNPSTYYLTDPSVCYVIFVAMVMIQVNAKLDCGRQRTAEAEEAGRSAWQLLQLFLQQLGNQWLLPKALIAAAEKFRIAASAPITLSDAYHIIQSLQRPLTFRPRREAKAQETRMISLMDLVTPNTSVDANDPLCLHDWLNAFDQGEMTFI